MTNLSRSTSRRAKQRRERRRREVQFWRRSAEITQRLRQGEGRVFRELLGTEVVEQLLFEIGHAGQDRIDTPVVVLGVFLSQVLAADYSCRAAVARRNADRIARRLSPCSPETGAYCVARTRLPDELFSQLVRTTGARIIHVSPDVFRSVSMEKDLRRSCPKHRAKSAATR